MNKNEILEFWFPNESYNNFWFKSTNELDNLIYQKYYPELKNKMDNFNIDFYNDITSDDLLIDIILLDQFSRNINRIIEIDIKTCTVYAIKLSQIWIDKSYYLTKPINYTVFALMPLRHSFEPEKLQNLILILESLENKKIGINNIVFQKFKFHTIRNYEKLNNYFSLGFNLSNVLLMTDKSVFFVSFQI